jgi:serine phosphatase RsbU (regulator of sigma subunit)
MARLNDFLYSVSLPTQFATAQLFRIKDGNVMYANAAHPGFLHFQRSSGKATLFEQPSYLLGAMPAMLYDEHALKVSPGDTLFVYTDGLTDRRNESGEFYAIDRVAALMEQSRDADIGTLYETIFRDVNAFNATEDFKDDIAFVVTRFH